MPAGRADPRSWSQQTSSSAVAPPRQSPLHLVAKRFKLATEMMRPDAGLHADQARRQVGKAGLHLAARPLLAQYNGTTLIVAHNVERVLTDIDANHSD